jgi:hypothetical protein
MRKISITALTLTLLTVSACGTASNSGSFCDLYQPVRTLEDGRKDQRDAIDKNNAVYLEKCTNWTRA